MRGTYAMSNRQQMQIVIPKHTLCSPGLLQSTDATQSLQRISAAIHQITGKQIAGGR
jgi:hypothetical protein